MRPNTFSLFVHEHRFAEHEYRFAEHEHVNLEVSFSTNQNHWQEVLGSPFGKAVFSKTRTR